MPYTCTVNIINALIINLKIQDKMSISSINNKYYTENPNQSWRQKQCICFHGYIKKKGGHWEGDGLLERKKTKQSQYIKCYLLGSVFDYMSIILVYQSSFLNGSRLIFILVNKEFLLNRFTFIFLGFYWNRGCGEEWRKMTESCKLKSSNCKCL